MLPKTINLILPQLTSAVNQLDPKAVLPAEVNKWLQPLQQKGQNKKDGFTQKVI